MENPCESCMKFLYDFEWFHKIHIKVFQAKLWLLPWYSAAGFYNLHDDKKFFSHDDSAVLLDWTNSVFPMNKH